MRKVLLFLSIFMLPAYSLSLSDIGEYDGYLDKLYLNQKQISKIEKIKQEYGAEITRINAQIILNNMHCAILRPEEEVGEEINYINILSKNLQEELDDILEERINAIANTLNWLQRYRYKQFMQGKNPTLWELKFFKKSV